MKSSVALLLTCVFALALLSGCPDQGIPDGPGSLTVTHDDVDASVIPASYITQVQSLDVYFEHASVGGNIMNGLRTMASAAGSRYTYDAPPQYTYDSGTQPTGAQLAEIAVWFDNNNGFVDFMRGNPGFDSKRDWFYEDMNFDIGGSSMFATHMDVAMFKFCWIDDVYISGNVASQFATVRTAMESLEANYPGTIFVWFTMPIFESGNQIRAEYNELVRNYCEANSKPLFDIADIESHDPNGDPVTDAGGFERIADEYENDGGHPNATGEALLANAWWILMARLCGWEG